MIATLKRNDIWFELSWALDIRYAGYWKARRRLAHRLRRRVLLREQLSPRETASPSSSEGRQWWRHAEAELRLERLRLAERQQRQDGQPHQRRAPHRGVLSFRVVSADVPRNDAVRPRRLRLNQPQRRCRGQQAGRPRPSRPARRARRWSPTTLAAPSRSRSSTSGRRHHGPLPTSASRARSECATSGRRRTWARRPAGSSRPTCRCTAPACSCCAEEQHAHPQRRRRTAHLRGRMDAQRHGAGVPPARNADGLVIRLVAGRHGSRPGRRTCARSTTTARHRLRRTASRPLGAA